MAYVSPTTRSTGDLITAAIWNQDVVSNPQASAPDVFTTKGDVFIATAADAGQRLGVGSNNQLLTADSACTVGMKWATGGIATDTFWGAKGDLAVADANDSACRLAVSGSDGALLAEDSACNVGLKWVNHNVSAAVHGLPASVNVLGNRSAAGEFVQRAVLGNLSLGGSDVPHFASAETAVTFAVAFSSRPHVWGGGGTNDIILHGAGARSVTTTGFAMLVFGGTVTEVVNAPSWVALGA